MVRDQVDKEVTMVERWGRDMMTGQAGKKVKRVEKWYRDI